MCELFDQEYQIATDAGGCTTSTGPQCPDRQFNWSADFVTEFAIGNAAMDCHIAGIFPTDPTLLNDYSNDLIAWTLQFFGCPFANPTVDAGPYGFGLIPRNLAGNTIFTMGDLQLLSSYYVQAVEAALAAPCSTPAGCSSSPVTNPLPPLTQGDGGTPGQLEQVNAMLNYLASQVPGTNPSTTTYTFDSCAPDGGTDASDGGGGG
jgi:hypothetical protein